MTEGLAMIHDTLDFMAGKKKQKTKLYAKWVNCPKGKCPEGYGGKCNRAMFERNPDLVYGYPAEYPADGKCYFPFFHEYDPEWETDGVYETEADNA